MTETTPKKTFRQVCTCENCGNEAEMVITCSLEPDEDKSAPQTEHVHGSQPAQKHKTGQATCTHCGNEAEIIIDL